MVKKAVKFLVQGTVQGIFFRQFVKEHADNLRLTGFVRNLENGIVEIVVEGEQGGIDRLAHQVEQGPEHSQIRSVDVKEQKWSGDFSEFKILRF